MTSWQPDDRPESITFLAPCLCSPSTGSFSHLREFTFYDFPESKGWTLDYGKRHQLSENLLSHRNRLPRVSQELVRSRPRSALNLQCYRIDGGGVSVASLQERMKFLQEWLFFGVLFKASSICELSIDIEREFLVEAGTPGYNLDISTAALNGLAERLLESAQSQASVEEFRSRMHQLRLLVDYVASFYCPSYGHDDTNGEEKLKYLEYKVMFSIQIVLRVIVRTLKISGVFNGGDVQALSFSVLYLPFSSQDICKVASAELLRQGWCRSEVTMLNSLARGHEEYIFFATLLERQRKTHDDCDTARCLADNIDETTYQTAHTSVGCACSHANINVNDLVTILERDEIPIVLISDDLELSIVSGHSFVAISHVWSHGLGNPFQNSLPKCQLRRLRNHVSNLCISHPELDVAAENGVCAVWIDTLCIPVARHLASYRAKAIHLLGRTYTNATVLVLDSELEALNSRQTSILEQNLRICCSGWMRRLWTLQEAMLSRELFIQLHDVSVQLIRPLCIALNERFSFDLASDSFLTSTAFDDTMNQRIPTATGLRVPANTHNRIGSAYKNLISAVQYRSTSKMQDEPAILATLMGLDNRGILAAKDKMAEFHILVKNIPADLIFLDLNGKSLKHSPFRWAPSTLLESEIQAFAKSTEYPLAKCDEDGLHVVYGGFIITNEFDETEGLPSWIQREFSIRDRRQGDKYRMTLKPKFVDAVKWPRASGLIFNGGVALIVEILDNGWIKSEGSYAVEGEATVVVVAHAEFTSLNGEESTEKLQIPEFMGDVLRPWRGWCI
ncbi:hypothetical protein V8C34DRAFT_285994, partial [Trichoderma compactum]